jgi:hypothetical protein
VLPACVAVTPPPWARPAVSCAWPSPRCRWRGACCSRRWGYGGRGSSATCRATCRWVEGGGTQVEDTKSCLGVQGKDWHVSLPHQLFCNG